MKTDFQNVDNPEGQKKAQKAQNALNSSNSGTEQLFNQLVYVFSNFFGLLTYLFILFSFNVWIVLILFALTLANYFVGSMFNKWYHKNKDNWAMLDRKIDYVDKKAGDYNVAKDIRIFNMASCFITLFNKFFSERMSWKKKEENYNLFQDIATIVITFLRDGLAYGLLVYQIVFNDLTVADFILYFAIITQYSNWLLGFAKAINEVRATSFTVDDIREFLDMPDRFNRNTGVALPSETCSIEFKNVSFEYPKTEDKIFNNLSFNIKKGEKIAIVGNNGAGKTTLIKIMCGLYEPCGGEVCFNGNPISAYNIEDFYTMFSVVFQDIYFMPTTIAKNIALVQEKNINQDKLNSVILASGLDKKIKSLPSNKETLLGRGICEGGIELSGGEKQKVALSRALYKDGLVVVLDEPTAALDPIAESKIYLKYNELTVGRTSIFISHRLSSTRFCDRILFLEQGEIVEEGTHSELMDLNGKYAYMFELQSRYYKDNDGGEKI